MKDEEILEDTSSKKEIPRFLKLYKNSKGYNWEIKIDSNSIEELEKLNNEMIEKFG